jgi:hypothetical protein
MWIQVGFISSSSVQTITGSDSYSSELCTAEEARENDPAVPSFRR